MERAQDHAAFGEHMAWDRGSPHIRSGDCFQKVDLTAAIVDVDAAARAATD